MQAKVLAVPIYRRRSWKRFLKAALEGAEQNVTAAENVLPLRANRRDSGRDGRHQVCGRQDGELEYNRRHGGQGRGGEGWYMERCRDYGSRARFSERDQADFAMAATGTAKRQI